MSNNPNPQQKQVNVQIRYDELTARYANQVLLNTTAEEVYLDFSPGVIFDRGGNGGAILPINTRIAMTPVGLLRLYQAIGKALQNYKVTQNTPAPAPGDPVAVEEHSSETNS